MFPSEAYRELCIKHEKELRKEWKPKFGDLVLSEESGHTALVLHYEPEPKPPLDAGGPTVYLLFFPGILDRVVFPVFGTSWGAPVLEYWITQVIPLFQPRQLIEMLEERGWLWSQGKEYEHLAELHKVEPYWVIAHPPYRKSHDIYKKKLHFRGPGPATALLKAYLEVVKDG